MRTRIALVTLSTLVALTGCGPQDDTELAPENLPAERNSDPRRNALASVMGGVEAAIDAPWRLDPIGFDAAADSTVYPDIPIIVTIHDASMQMNPDTKQPLGRFCELVIKEEWNDGLVHYGPIDPTKQWDLVTRIPANSPLVREIERSEKWPYSSDTARNHAVCRHWAGEDCASVLDVGSSAEWHATIAYRPQQYAHGGTLANGFSALRDGDDVLLTIEARVASAGRPCGTGLSSPSQTSFDRLWPVTGGYAITNTLSVHLGEANLPRFDRGWVYGDLHYHSQATDNEGESGYAYRPTLQAMRAMGLDFVFATDHASDSAQVTDLDGIYLDKRFDVPYAPAFLADYANDLARTFQLGVKANVTAARDMNPPRFVAFHEWLNRPVTGANAESARAFEGGAMAPRIFLGGEVDAIPEISAAEQQSGLLHYGNGRTWLWGSSCWEVPDPVLALSAWTTVNLCSRRDELTDLASEGGRYLLKDIQGLADQYYARQHIVFLPTDGTRNDTFVSSRTTLYGGAHERLKDLLTPGYWNSMVGRGVAFLAHPVSAPIGNDFGRLGPDVVPYSDAQLRTAFESPLLLGLQLWNEDARLESGRDAPGFPRNLGWLTSARQWGKWRGREPAQAYTDLHDGLYAWDKMLQWGLRLSQTSGLSWLNPGEPRRVFMAGGSDAHGDWNYRREGALDGVSGFVDTAIGKPRNLVNVGFDRPGSSPSANGTALGAVGQSQVTDALIRGEFSVTDGPALRIAIDNNGNGIIDAGDTAMGGVQMIPNGVIPLIVEWKSTPEFRVIKSIDVYVGVANDATDTSLVYAPLGHGIHSVVTPSGEVDPHDYKDANGASHRTLKDGYMLDPTGLLHIVPMASDGNAMVGRRRIVLRADDFPVGRLHVLPDTPPEEICVPNDLCNKPGSGDACELVCHTPKAPPPTYHFEAVTTPTRLYVRAFARTQAPLATTCDGGSATAVDIQRRGGCIERLAFTNPVWVTRRQIIRRGSSGDVSMSSSGAP